MEFEDPEDLDTYAEPNCTVSITEERIDKSTVHPGKGLRAQLHWFGRFALTLPG